MQKSSGITRRAKRSDPPETSSLPTEVQETIAEAMPIYEQMYARRILPCAKGGVLRTADMIDGSNAKGAAGEAAGRAANGSGSASTLWTFGSRATRRPKMAASRTRRQCATST